MTYDMVKSHRIHKYFRCSPKEFPTGVYISIMPNPLLPPFPLSIFLYQFFASITAVYNRLYNTSVVDPLLNNPHKLISSPTSTPNGIISTSLICSSLNASWKHSSIYLIEILLHHLPLKHPTL